MSSRPSRLLPALIALTLLGTGGTAGWAAADLRAEERRAEQERRKVAAAEAEARAVEAYRAAVEPLAAELYGEAQPFVRAMQDATDVELLAAGVLEDVSQVLVDTKPFDALHARLSSLTAPRSVYTQHLQMQSGLKDFADAADLAAGVAGQEDVDDVIPALVSSEQALASATRTWRTPVETLFAGLPLPPVPAQHPDGDPAPRPATRTSYLYEAGARCASSLGRIVEQIEGRVDDDAHVARVSFTVLREDLPALIALSVPEADAGTLRDTITAPLEDTRSASGLVAPLLDTLLSGRGTPAQAREVETLLTRGEVAAERAAAGFRAYGSTTCSGYLVGFEDEPGSADEDEDVERPT